MDIRKISLEGRVPKAGPLNFLSVEVPVSPDHWIPFALVRYSRSGNVQEHALRLDLDKRTFADDLEGNHELLRTMGGKIADIVAADLRNLAVEDIAQAILNQQRGILGEK